MESFEPYGSDEGQTYPRAFVFVPETLEKEVINLLTEIRIKGRK